MLTRTDEILAKLDQLGRAVGGDRLVIAWDELEEKAGRGIGTRTFTRSRVRQARENRAKERA